MKKPKPTFYLGGTLRTSEGIKYVPSNARAMGYNLVQIQLAKSTEYRPHLLSDEALMEYKKNMFGILSYILLPRMINMSESDPNKRSFYKMVVIEYMKQAYSLGARGIIVTAGYMRGISIQQAVENTTAFIDSIYETAPDIELYIETDNGDPTFKAIGNAGIVSKICGDVENDVTYMCVDTANLYARGLNLWDKQTRKDFMEDYADRIRLVQLNVPDWEVEKGSFKSGHNTPFIERPDLPSAPLCKEFLKLAPCILERESLQVQDLDMEFIRDL